MKPILAFLLFTLATTAASADVIAPPRWSLSQSDRGVVMSNSCVASKGAVAYAVFPASLLGGDDIAKWLTSRSGSMLAAWTGPHQPTPVRSDSHIQGDIALETYDFTSSDGAEMSALFVGNAMGDRGQAYAVIAPRDSTSGNADMDIAIEHLLALVAEHFSLDPTAITQVPLQYSATPGEPEPVVQKLVVSDLRNILLGHVAPEPHDILLTRDGRFFVDEVSEYAVQGRWERLDNGYSLKYGDGVRGFVPIDCVRPEDTAEGSSELKSGKDKSGCRTVHSTRTEMRTMTVCDPNHGCSPRTLPTQIPYDEEVCD